MREHVLIILINLLSFSLYAQNIFKGIVVDEFGEGIENVKITSNNTTVYSNSKGEFSFEMLSKKEVQLLFEHLFFEELEAKITKPENKIYEFQMNTSVFALEESVIQHFHETKINNSETINQDFIQKEASGSLAKALEKLPGVQSMDIGSSTSKPVIRGLGSNRIAITENGIKQESQQWGDDHGLEISPWNAEQVEILKGSAALEYGSDAVGGVIAIRNDQKPRAYSTKGEVNLLARSVNQSLGSALNFAHLKENFYYKVSGSYMDFGDYSVPTHQIVFQNEIIPIENKRLENTAGREYSVSSLVGYTSDKFETSLLASNYYQKIGMFPISHGDAEDLHSDGNRRNIDFPYQNVNHFKLQSESIFRWNKQNLRFLFGYQINHRQEWSEFHEHYGEEHGEHDDDHDEHGEEGLELDFKLATYDAQLKYQWAFSSNNKLNLGVQTQIQENRINGFGFLLPEFDRSVYSAYAINELKLHPKWRIHYGLRYDHSELKTSAYYDQHLFEYLTETGYLDDEAQELAQRSEALNKNYQNLNYSFGVLFQAQKEWDFNLNFATNFRIPTAIELASNGIHHGSFRHEIGNSNLDPEKGWSGDFKIRYHKNSWDLELNPYFYQFENYIFLNPTNELSPLPGGGEIYKYEQSKARLAGFEFNVEKEFGKRLTGIASVEYAYNEQVKSEGDEPLPLSPPLVIFNEWTYSLFQNRGVFENLDVAFNVKWAGDQNKVAENEKTTKGYTLLGATIQSRFKINSFEFDVVFNANNLTDQKYFNHLSFYRNLDIPEMGRNFSLLLRIPFGN